MKRIRWAVSALFLFAGLALQAAPVPKDRALDIARQVFAAQPATKAAGDVKFLWDGEDIATKSNVQPAFYVFTRDGGGFVIVAGDDNVQPVLALSDRNEFKVDGMPANVKWWMDRMKAYVRAAKTQSPAVRDQWLQFASTKAGTMITGEVTDKEEHLTPEWNQGNTLLGKEIFNTKCPLDPNNPSQHTLTGCVATAISEVLTTMSGIYGVQGVGIGGKMPTHPLVASVEPYTVPAGFVPATVDGNSYVFTDKSTYDWEGLRNLTNTAAIAEIVKASQNANPLISKPAEELLQNMDQLLADMGAIMHAWYSTSATNATTAQAPDTMIKYMGIYKGAYFEKAANYTHTQWREKLKAELSKHPIVYSGRTVAFPDAPSGYGHSFVFDGYGKYAGEDVFHVNFGWSGNCSGYYYETSLDPYGRSDYNFSYECGATFNFYPDPASEATFKMTLADEGFEYDADPPTKAGDLLQFSMAFLKNDGPEAYYGAAKLVAEHKDGTPIKVLYTEDYSDDPITPNGGAVWFNVDEPIDFDVTFGDRVVCYYSIGTEWIRLEAFPKNGAILDELPLMPVAFIQTADSYKVNDWFEFAVKNIARRYDDAVWTITRPDGTVVGGMYMSDRDFKLTQAGVYKIEVSLPYNYDGNEVIVTYIEVN